MPPLQPSAGRGAGALQPRARAWSTAGRRRGESQEMRACRGGRGLSWAGGQAQLDLSLLPCTPIGVRGLGPGAPEPFRVVLPGTRVLPSLPRLSLSHPTTPSPRDACATSDAPLPWLAFGVRPWVRVPGRRPGNDGVSEAAGGKMRHTGQDAIGVHARARGHLASLRAPGPSWLFRL